MNVEKSDVPDKLHPARSAAGNIVNPSGAHELEVTRELQIRGWPKMHDGKVLKVVFAWVNFMAVHRYKVIAMQRDILEIQASYLDAFRTKIPREIIERMITDGMEVLNNRRDVELFMLNYVDVLHRPDDVFSDLKNNGWPIDSKKAAAVVNQSLYRHRRERGQ